MTIAHNTNKTAVHRKQGVKANHIKTKTAGVKQHVPQLPSTTKEYERNTPHQGSQEWTVHMRSECGTSTLQSRRFPNKPLLDQCVIDVTDKLHIKPHITVFGKPANQQRDVAFFSATVPHYKYSNQQMDAQPLTEAMEELLEIVNTSCNTRFDAILVNRYSDGTQYIGAHSDDEKGLGDCVVSLSWGATRTFRIRDKKPNKRVIDVPMDSGMLMCMCGRFQSLYKHEVPKQLRVKSARVSFTFRAHPHMHIE